MPRNIVGKLTYFSAVLLPIFNRTESKPNCFNQIVEDLGERKDFVDKCKKNKLKVICVLTEPEEFKKYSGMDGLLDFYR